MFTRVEAPILPGESLGGIRVGDPVRRYAEDFLRYELRREISFRMVGLFEATYILANGAIEVAVDVRNGKIARVTAARGYTGMLDNGVHVGMTVREAMAVDNRLHYDEPSELILRRGESGLSLALAERDPFPDAVPALRIVAISVYHPVLDTKAGQTGDW